MSQLVINGQDKQVEKSRNIAQLLLELGLGERRVAVMVNDRIVRRDQHEATPLEEGDRVEIVQMVGGG